MMRGRCPHRQRDSGLVWVASFSRKRLVQSRAGMPFQRQGEAAEAVRGVGSARSRSLQGTGPEMTKGADNLTKSTQATSSVRTTEPNWPTFLRALDSVSG